MAVRAPGETAELAPAPAAPGGAGLVVARHALPASADQPPLTTPRFVGREQELSLLRRALAGSAVVLIEGEAGVGKSRLVRELVAGGEQRYAVGSCPPFPESPALASVVEAVRYAAGELTGVPLSPLAGALRPLFPEWSQQLPPAPEPLADPAAAQHRLFRALAELVGELGVSVLVAEDVHWADTATLEFLLFLVDRRQQPVSVVATYRPEEVPPESLLLRLSSRLPTTAARLRVQVSPLDPAAATALVSSMFDGEPVAPELAQLLHEHTDGLPLALEESVRLLRDRAELMRRDQGWTRRGGAELPVPPTVRDAVLERVRGLDRLAHRVLQACAVLAEPAPEALVVEASGLPEEQARAGLSAAVAGGLLAEDPNARLGFRHVLVGRAIYDSLPAGTRQELHRRVGLGLADRRPLPLLRLTRHFRAAGDVWRWQRYAELAARQAVDHGDHSTATVVLGDLLAGGRLPAATQVRLARDLIDATLLRRDAVDQRHRRVVATLRELLRQDWLGPPEEAELRHGLGRLLAQRGNLTAAREELERAVPHLDHDPVQAARAMAFLGIPFIGDQPAAVHRAWLRRAGEVDPGELTASQRLALTIDRASGLLALGEPEGWEVAAEIPAWGSRAVERRQVTRGHLNVGTMAVTWGHYGRARRELRAALRLAEADRYHRVRDRILVALARLDWHVGAWDGLPDRLAALTVAGDRDPVGYLATLRHGVLCLATGETRTGERLCRRALELAHRVGAVNDLLEPAAAVARSRLAAGAVAEAERLTRAPMRMVASKDVWVWATDIAPVRLQVLAALGAMDEATALVEQFARGLGDRDAPAGQAALLTCQAWAATASGQPEEAAGRFAEAATAWGRLPRPYESALAREQQARCLLEAGQPRLGADLLTRTHQRLSTLGASGDAARVGELLRAQGVEPADRRRRGRKGYGDRLSPRELEVVRQVVTGATNREIAEVLSRSPKTVAGQLSSAMRKLEVSSRTALAVAAVDAGLVAESRLNAT